MANRLWDDYRTPDSEAVVRGTVSIYAPAHRDGGDGKTLSTLTYTAQVTDGQWEMENVPPGMYVVSWRLESTESKPGYYDTPRSKPVIVVAADGDQRLRTLVGAAPVVEAPTDRLAAAVADYLTDNPVTGAVTDEAVAAVVDQPATKTALDNAYAPIVPASATTAIIQARINVAEAAGGGTVTLASGQTYTVTGLTMKTGVHLDLNGSTLKLANGTAASLISTEGYATLVGGDTTGGPRDWSIRNGFLDGNKANQSGTPSTFPPVLAIYGRRYVLDNLVVCNGFGSGIVSRWSTTSPFQTPNGFESWVTRVYVHSCKYDGISFSGPHDTFFSNLFIVKCGEESAAVPLRFPDSSGRANGCNVQQFHIYGGNGYSFGLLANTAGMRFCNFVVEGSQTAQVLVQASQVMLDGFHLYAGGIAGATVKGIQFGDATHTGINGSTVRGRVENCGGGAADVTYLGWNNDIDLHHFYLSSTTPTKTDLGLVGTLVGRNQVRLRTTDSGPGSGGTFFPTAAQRNITLGPVWASRSNSADTADLLQLRSEADVVLHRVDWRGRRRVVTSGPVPTVAAGAGAGTSPTVAVSGDDTAGKVTITVGTSPPVGPTALAAVTFSGAFGNAPHVTLTAGDERAAIAGLYVTTSTTAFTVRCAGTPEAGESLTIFYSVVGA